MDLILHTNLDRTVYYLHPSTYGITQRCQGLFKTSQALDYVVDDEIGRDNFVTVTASASKQHAMALLRLFMRKRQVISGKRASRVQTDLPPNKWDCIVDLTPQYARKPS
jgi:hypothetical protein